MVFPVVENAVPAIDVPASPAKTPAETVKHMIDKNVFIIMLFIDLCCYLGVNVKERVAANLITDISVSRQRGGFANSAGTLTVMLQKVPATMTALERSVQSGDHE